MAKIHLLDRQKVIILYQQGLTIREIQRQVKGSISGIHYIIKKFKKSKCVGDLKRSGRPRKLTPAAEKHLKLLSLRNRKKNSTQLAQEIAEATGTRVSSSLVRRKLISFGLRGCVAKKKTFFRRGNKQKRLKFVKEHENWTEEDWKKVLWTDESKFEMFGSRRRQYVRRRPGEEYLEDCLNPTMKHGGGSIMVWGCFSGYGVGDLIKIEGKMDAKKYHHILSSHAIPSGLRLIGPGFVLQQDNDPKHTARSIKEYLARKEEQGQLKCMEWPPQSPDFNLIEHLWELLDRKRVERQPKSLEDLWRILKEEWEKISPDYIASLISSIKDRLLSAKRNKGGHTKY